MRILDIIRNKEYTAAKKKELIEKALAEGASLDEKTNDGQSLLYEVCTTDKSCSPDEIELIEFFLEKKPALLKPNLQNNPNSNSTRIRYNKIEMVFAIHQKDHKDATADAKKNLHLAAKIGDLKAVKDIVKVEGKAVCIQRDAKGWAPFHYAAANNHLEVVKFFLRNNIDLNIKTDTLDTALHLASRYGHFQIVFLLLSLLTSGLGNIWSPIGKNIFGLSPMHVAIENDHENVLACFLEDIQARAGQGVVRESDKNQVASWLNYAVECGSLQSVKWLVKSCKAESKVDGSGDLPISQAVKRGFIKAVEFLIETNRELINSTDKDGWNLLHIASDLGKTDIVTFLLEKRPELINVQHATGNSALHMAAQKGHSTTVKKLLELKADVNSRNNKESLPIHWAVRTKNTEVVQQLIDAKCSINDDGNGKAGSPLYSACRIGHLETVQTLMAAKADCSLTYQGFHPVHVASLLGYEDIVSCLFNTDKEMIKLKDDINGYSALHMAARHGHSSIVKKLLELKANVNSRNKKGNMVIHSAAEKGKTEVVKQLVDAKCSINDIGEGNSPLFLACQYGHLETVQYLVGELKTNCLVRERGDLSPILVACKCGHFKIVNYLLNHLISEGEQKGVDLLSENNIGSTLLFYASGFGYFLIVKRLVEQFKVNYKFPTQGVWPIHAAAGKGYIEIVAYFLDLDQGLIHLQDNVLGFTVLHCAAEIGHLSIVQSLLEKNANPNIRNKAGELPVDLAAKKQFVEIVKLLSPKSKKKKNKSKKNAQVKEAANLNLISQAPSKTDRELPEESKSSAIEDSSEENSSDIEVSLSEDSKEDSKQETSSQPTKIDKRKAKECGESLDLEKLKIQEFSKALSIITNEIILSKNPQEGKVKQALKQLERIDQKIIEAELKKPLALQMPEFTNAVAKVFLNNQASLTVKVLYDPLKGVFILPLLLSIKISDFNELFSFLMERLQNLQSFYELAMTPDSENQYHAQIKAVLLAVKFRMDNPAPFKGRRNVSLAHVKQYVQGEGADSPLASSLALILKNEDNNLRDEFDEIVSREVLNEIVSLHQYLNPGKNKQSVTNAANGMSLVSSSERPRKKKKDRKSSPKTEPVPLDELEFSEDLKPFEEVFAGSRGQGSQTLTDSRREIPTPLPFRNLESLKLGEQKPVAPYDREGGLSFAAMVKNPGRPAASEFRDSPLVRIQPESLLRSASLVENLDQHPRVKESKEMDALLPPSPKNLSAIFSGRNSPQVQPSLEGVELSNYHTWSTFIKFLIEFGLIGNALIENEEITEYSKQLSLKETDEKEKEENKKLLEGALRPALEKYSPQIVIKNLFDLGYFSQTYDNIYGNFYNKWFEKTINEVFQEIAHLPSNQRYVNTMAFLFALETIPNISIVEDFKPIIRQEVSKADTNVHARYGIKSLEQEIFYTFVINYGNKLKNDMVSQSIAMFATKKPKNLKPNAAQEDKASAANTTSIMHPIEPIIRHLASSQKISATTPKITVFSTPTINTTMFPLPPTVNPKPDPAQKDHQPAP